MIWLIDQIWHRLRGYAWVTAGEINAETGTMDDYCGCWLCHRKQDSTG